MLQFKGLLCLKVRLLQCVFASIVPQEQSRSHILKLDALHDASHQRFELNRDTHQAAKLRTC